MLHFHSGVTAASSGSTAAANRDIAELVARESGRRSPAAINDNVETLLKTRRTIQRNANVRLAMDVLGMKLAT